MPSRDVVREAQSKLDLAVDEFVSTMDWQGITTSWAMVMHQHHVDDTGEVASAYNLVYMGGTLPDHVARGLFETASDTIRGIGRWRLASGDDS